jgi:hypothetical protein
VPGPDAQPDRQDGPSKAPTLEAPRDDLAYLGFLEPEEVAARAVEGIKANRLYVFSHEAGRIPTAERFEEILGDFAVLPQPAAG